MTKNDKRQFDIARNLAAAGMCNAAVRTIATVHRCAMRTATKDAALALVAELELANRVAIVNGCMVHIDDAHLVGA
jgi:hypothetical protein